MSWTEPSGAVETAPALNHPPGATRCSSDTPLSPRILPPSCTDEPYVTSVPVGGGDSHMSPIPNQVERKPSAPATVDDGTCVLVGTGLYGCCESTSIDATRPEAFRVVVASVIEPCSFSVFASCAAVTGTGPQSWNGEIASYGSATGTRYGSAVPQMSRLDAVSPPEVEKKNVVAILFPKSTTWPFVASTALVVAAVSCEIPRYIWLRVSE